jgi:probable phosphoglycerate mutase
MRDLYLVRHGESEHHVRGITGGWTDLALTDRGHRQAAAAAERLQTLLSDGAVLYTSDLVRARQSAAPIATMLGCEAIVTDRLRELNNGVARDRTIDEAKSLEWPMTLPAWDWVPYDGAESWRELHTRIASCVDDLRTHDGDVVAVTHGHSIVCAVNAWLGIHGENEPTPSYDADPGSITRLRIDEADGSPTIAFLNDTRHLDGLD